MTIHIGADPAGRISVILSVEQIAASNVGAETVAIENPSAGDITNGELSVTHDVAESASALPGVTDAQQQIGCTAADEQLALVDSVRAEIDHAREVVDKKPVIIEKLGRARGVIDVILKSAEFVGEVSL